MPKTVTLRLEDGVYEEFRQAAEAENRPISNLIETAALNHLHEQQFVDDVEVAAPRVANDQLWFHHPEMQARIAKAEEDFASGRATRTTTPQQAQEFLDGLKKSRPQRSRSGGGPTSRHG